MLLSFINSHPRLISCIQGFSFGWVFPFLFRRVGPGKTKTTRRWHGMRLRLHLLLYQCTEQYKTNLHIQFLFPFSKVILPPKRLSVDSSEVCVCKQH